MAGVTTPKLVIAACKAGALGSHALAFLQPSKVEADLRETSGAISGRPFTCNVFAIPAQVMRRDQQEVAERAVAHLRSVLQQPELTSDLQIPSVNSALNVPYKEHLEAIAHCPKECRPVAVSFTFGLPDREDMQLLRDLGVVSMGTATTVEEAEAVVDAGLDVVIAQGIEAGGHRGSFQSDGQNGVGLIALVPQIVDAIENSVPVVASGGVMDRRGVAACMALGASAVQVGTAFLLTRESQAHPAHKKVLLQTSSSNTVVSNVFSGRYARGVSNEMYRAAITFAEAPVGESDCIAPYPLQQTLTNQIKQRAFAKEQFGFGSMWTGQGLGMAREGLSCEELVAELMQGVSAPGAPAR
uniref:Uncharacterized protein n=1 Tax=Chromera velia CCMP2878 TaxID=1169474 RepID=A0A0G4FAH3_9ALVE|eukprot:Cvel_15890.t1-p1 / transcript=Cvel_15890.t1 / gene=Cvel_15890 / organism=Chromera_velia_CCMP2878 / gene_product=Probable nitronate monooxygenase, putative / transcript_product=Probable nitronate monooxygenase, putative / location=Cvel_scaffold1200:8330-9394(+) / protein_length=355 / sequence_SO=supercontig / SO=protein_coding / is_pseudo=false